MKESVVISFEGLDNCGKGTQIKFLKEFLTGLGLPFNIDREPGGTIYGVFERMSLQDPEFLRKMFAMYPKAFTSSEKDFDEALDPVAEMLGYLKSRTQFYSLKVKPVVDEGGIYVLDRSGDSTIAYQGYGLFDSDPTLLRFIELGNKVAMKGVVIDRTYFLDISVDEMRRRKFGDDYIEVRDNIEQRKNAYFEKVRSGYQKLNEQDHYLRIDGSLSKEVIANKIKKDLLQILEEKGWVNYTQKKLV